MLAVLASGDQEPSASSCSVSSQSEEGRRGGTVSRRIDSSSRCALKIRKAAAYGGCAVHEKPDLGMWSKSTCY